MLFFIIIIAVTPIISLRGSEKDRSNIFGRVKGIKDISSRVVVARDGRPSGFEIKKPSRIDEYFGVSKYLSRDEMLEGERILVFPEDNVEFFPEPNLGLGSKIIIKRATEVIVNDSGKVQTYRTWGKTVGDFLEEKMVYLGLHDKLNPIKNTLISNGISIDIQRAADNIEVEHFYTPFQVIVKDDPWLANGKVRIKQQGIEGDRQIVWSVVRRADEELKRELVEDKIAQVVQDKIVLRGTKPVQLNGPYYDWIKEAAAQYGADPDQMYRVMMCESGGYPYALSPRQKYYGLFQYDRLTWSASGWGDHDIYDPQAQINAAAKAWKSRYTKWPITSKICGDLGK